MAAAATIRRARRTAGLSLRELAARAATSHSTLAAYEHGRKVPSAATLDRIVRAAGFELDRALARRHRHGTTAQSDRGDELVAVLELAAAFPARHTPSLDYPIFGGPNSAPASAP